MSGGAQAGLFRAVKQSQGWEDARNHQASKVTKPLTSQGTPGGSQVTFQPEGIICIVIAWDKGKRIL